jgi:hypothetical protein
MIEIDSLCNCLSQNDLFVKIKLLTNPKYEQHKIVSRHNLNHHDDKKKVKKYKNSNYVDTLDQIDRKIKNILG